MLYEDKKNNVHIRAGKLLIGNNVTFGKDIKINVRGKFEIGDNGIIGDRFDATAEEIIIGEYFYNGPTDSRGMMIGGGSSNFPYAKLKIGDGMVCHTGHINLASKISIGNNVGLSHDVDLITHGFWHSVFEGYPRTFKEINIGNNVIVGWKTVIMSGVDISDNIVIGSHSTVTKSLLISRGIYVGSPAKLIKEISNPSLIEKQDMLDNIIEDFKNLMKYYDVSNFNIDGEYPIIKINNLEIDVVNFSSCGEHDDVTDAFRDFIRRYGIRIFTPNGFRFKLERK